MPSTALVELKKQVKQANDIVDVISSYVALCLQLAKSTSASAPSTTIRGHRCKLIASYQNYRCWSCDARGDVFEFVMKFEKVAFPEAMRILATRAGIKLEADTLTEEDQHRAPLVANLEMVRRTSTSSSASTTNTGADAARDNISRSGSYWARRSSQFGLGFAPVNGDWLCKQAEAERLPPALTRGDGVDRRSGMKAVGYLRPFPRTGDVPHPRCPRANRRLRRSHLAHVATRGARPEVLQHVRDGTLQKARTDLRPGPRSALLARRQVISPSSKATPT